MWRVLKTGCIFFARLASGVGLEGQIERLEGKQYQFPDGSDRFLVDDRMLLAATDALGGELIGPLKTVVVRNLRSMSTLRLRKS